MVVDRCGNTKIYDNEYYCRFTGMRCDGVTMSCTQYKQCKQENELNKLLKDSNIK